MTCFLLLYVTEVTNQHDIYHQNNSLSPLILPKIERHNITKLELGKT